VDPSRAEIHLNPRGDKRELVVQVWYPAEQSNAPVAPYRRWIETTALSSYMAVLKTHSHLDVSVARSGAPFPVLLFNPAWKNERTKNTFQTEDLASHGFIVIGIDHTYNSQPIAFPDGRRLDSRNVADIGDFDHHTLAEEIARGDEEATYEAGDDIFVLDAFALMNQNPQSIFFKEVDVNRSGAFGHSFGGGVSMEACRRDSRIRAAMNMDGWIFGDVALLGLDKPLLLMYGGADPVTQPDFSVGSLDTPAGRLDGMNEHDLQDIKSTISKFGAYVLSFREDAQMGHFSFSDRALYSPVRRLTSAGRADPRRAHQIIEAYTLGFFSHILKGTTEPILAPGEKPFSEASLLIWKPSANAANESPKSLVGKKE
jgi:predicted dienelactone hydrolase